MGPPDPQTAYEVIEVKDTEWLREHFKAVSVEGDVLIRGACRRCGHEVDKRLAAETILTFEEERSAARIMRCNCLAEHDGREAGQGCGAYWGLRLNPGA